MGEPPWSDRLFKASFQRSCVRELNPEGTAGAASGARKQTLPEAWKGVRKPFYSLLQGGTYLRWVPGHGSVWAASTGIHCSFPLQAQDKQ